jgi:hypothetical protein
MEDNSILKDISRLDRIESELHKIKSINESINEFYIKDKNEFETKLEQITTTFKTKLEDNKQVSNVVDEFINEFVTDISLREKARNKLFYLLSGELVGVFRGLQHTNGCVIL